MRIGIDVGGTNTDAALICDDQVLAGAKSQTTEDVTSGVTSVIQKVLQASGHSHSDVSAVMVGTTHFVNAFVQRKSLLNVACIRIGLPLGSGIPPLVDWPDDLREQIGEHIYMIGGGSYFNGHEYATLDEQALQQAAEDIKAKGITAIAISSVFAPVRPDIETKAAEILNRHLGTAYITLSHQVGGIGLVERENAAIINASLQALSRKVVPSLHQALKELGIDAPLYLSHNDGTLMSTDYAMQFPVMTCSAGPTNSIRGAAFLSGLEEAIVVDIGGTTSDIGGLSKGFPRETSDASDIGGVRTNFSMPDVLSIGLGGGTLVKHDEQGIILGPESVGYQLTEKAMIFGGDVLTTSDIAVANGQMKFGDASLVSHLNEEFIDRVCQAMKSKLESAIDQLKISAEPIPVILVGGGAHLISGELKGTSRVIHPTNSDVANAIGAAIAQVGGRVKRLFDYQVEGGREAALEKAKQEAINNAINAGAQPGTVKVIELEEYPMTHVQSHAVDVKVKAVGQLGE
ncbi:hydantoinase/oxoprolinase family protein [Shewanella corallii]|uniref:Hydantoinase/oxoprolinase family protein n=1 Tax=Shewanella corallii TaxID=560080 RepID=A0ABT0N4V0_9GAMM|nr:hydantoinase/oxoprolinase family protein [Shewanella corallii]MCL2913476.1 hydantoinase/oxoprolinase family protein [Shewanella corallii]